MRKKPETYGGRNGVVLVLVLGLLSVLTILAVAFMSAMLVQQLAASNHTNSVRTEEMMQTALVRAMITLNATMVGKTYPCFSNQRAQRAEAMGSSGSLDKCTSLLTSEVLAGIPRALMDDATFVAANDCDWVPIIANGATNGRVAYHIINASGLVDINIIGGRTPYWCTNANELEIPRYPAPFLYDPRVTTSNFAAARMVRDRRYETMAEALAICKGLPSDPLVAGRSLISTNNDVFFTYSLDPGRDQYFHMVGPNDTTNLRTIGRPDANLKTKFNINGLFSKNPDGSYHFGTVADPATPVTYDRYYNANPDAVKFKAEYFGSFCIVVGE